MRGGVRGCEERGGRGKIKRSFLCSAEMGGWPGVRDMDSFGIGLGFSPRNKRPLLPSTVTISPE